MTQRLKTSYAHTYTNTPIWSSVTPSKQDNKGKVVITENTRDRLQYFKYHKYVHYAQEYPHRTLYLENNKPIYYYIKQSYNDQSNNYDEHDPTKEHISDDNRPHDAT